MVAKSYEGLPTMGDPFTIKGRQYVTVILKDGRTKDVRWYTEAEYRKLYGLIKSQEVFRQIKSQRDILGFAKGYITIYKGATFKDKDFFSDSPNCRYHKIWKWYTPSTEHLPFALPEHITPVKLPWEMVGGTDGKLYDDETVAAAVTPLLYEADDSEFQGKEGERIETQLTVTRVIALDSNFGTANMHIMRDAAHNCFVWITTAKTLEPGAIYNIKGTIKAHKFYQNTKQTILTRCYTTKVESKD